MQKKYLGTGKRYKFFKSIDGTGTKKVPRYNCTRYCPPLAKCLL